MKKKKKYFMFSLLFLVLALGLLLPHSVQAAKKNTTKYTIYVNRKTNLVNVVDAKSKKVVRAMYCSTGKNYRTIKGTYYTKAKYRWRYLKGNVYGQYATRINGSYLFHSVPYYKKNVKTVETVEYNKLGSQASLGCVRLTVADAKWIYDNCRIGTKVVINDKKQLEKPLYLPIKISTENKSGWDPTDPDKRNPYYPNISVKSDNAVIPLGSDFEPLSCVEVSSPVSTEEELQETLTVKGKVNTMKSGKYTLTYSVKDPWTELTTIKKITFTVSAP